MQQIDGAYETVRLLPARAVTLSCQQYGYAIIVYVDLTGAKHFFSGRVWRTIKTQRLYNSSGCLSHLGECILVNTGIGIFI